MHPDALIRRHYPGHQALEGRISTLSKRRAWVSVSDFDCAIPPQPIRCSLMKSLVALVSLSLAFLIFPPVAQAWGGTGCRVTAAEALRRLFPILKTTVTERGMARAPEPGARIGARNGTDFMAREQAVDGGGSAGSPQAGAASTAKRPFVLFGPMRWRPGSPLPGEWQENLAYGLFVAAPLLSFGLLIVFVRRVRRSMVPTGWGRLVVGNILVFCCLRSEEHTSELQSLRHLVCRLLLE